MSHRLVGLLRGSAPARLYSSVAASGAKLPSAPAADGTSGPRDVIREQQERCSVPVAADEISDAPQEMRQRPVRIFKPSKSSNTSGKSGTAHWRVDFDILQGSARWENPLMGWASTADYMQATNLKFKTLEDAVHFCEKQNWPYFVQQPHAPRIPPKSYSANYDYSPGKLRLHQTK